MMILCNKYKIDTGDVELGRYNYIFDFKITLSMSRSTLQKSCSHVQDNYYKSKIFSTNKFDVFS